MKSAISRCALNIVLAASLALPAVPLRAEESGARIVLVADRGCRGVHGGERDRCERRRDDRRSNDKVKDGIAAGIFGLALGAIIAGAAKNAESKRDARADWIARCSARYSSFDPRSGTFTGSDGRLYYCR